MTLEYSQQTFMKCSNNKFHTNPSNGSRDVPYGWMDRKTETFNIANSSFHWSQWSRGLRHDSAATRLLVCGFESCRRHEGLPLVSVVCWQAEISASGSSFAQRSPTACGVSVCDCEASIMMRPWLTRAGLTNLWPTCPIWHTAFVVPVFFNLFCLTSLSKLWRTYVCVCVCVCVYIYLYIYLTVHRVYMNYSCYQIALRVKHFYTSWERCEVLTKYLSPGHRPDGDWVNFDLISFPCINLMSYIYV
jgi:hypothetical protein